METIQKLSEIYHDAQKCAEIAGLEYTLADDLEISRVKKGKGFAYQDSQDNFIVTKDFKDRVNKLSVPPALKDVKIASSPKAHLQAVGTDSKNRKQYFYHPKWQEIRKLLNFYRVMIVGQNIDKIRQTYQKHIRQQELDINKASAGAVAIIDKTLMRVGNEYYAKHNDTYGVATMRKKHLHINPNKDEIEFTFTGKSGIEQDIKFKDHELSQFLEKLSNVPGYELFKYYDDKGNKKDLTANDVNTYLKQITDHQITAKDFRTWGGTRYYVKELMSLWKDQQTKSIADILTNLVDAVAAQLGNTRSVSKNFYIHPQLLEVSDDDHAEDIDRLLEIQENYHDLDRTTLEFLGLFIDNQLEELLAT